MLTASLLETIISAGSIVRPTQTMAAGVLCLCVCGQLRRGKSERVAHAVKVNDRMLRQTLCSSLAPRCSF